MKPFLSNKNIITTQIKRKEKEKVITDGLKLSNEFSNFFECRKSEIPALMNFI